MDLPLALNRFLLLFNRGEYWASHEALEPAWRKTGSPFYHGLILYASAWVHLARGNSAGVEAQMGKAEQVLRPFAPGYLGLDVRRILNQGDLLRSGHPDDRHIHTEGRFFRGDEPELAAD